MKIKILLTAFAAWTALLFVSCSSSLNPLGGAGTTSLFPMQQSGKNGYINVKGEVVIQPQFEFTLPFSEGLAPACIEREKCGYIDETGKFVVNPQFESVFRFSDGLAAVVVEGKLGYIDKTGKFVVNPQFESMHRDDSSSTFSEGLALVKIGDKYGFIDKTGKIVVNPQFESGFPFFDGLAAVQIGRRWGFVDKEGKIVVNPQFDEAQPFVNDLAAVRVGAQYGYIDKAGKIVVNPQFTDAFPFSDEDLAMIQVGNKVGFIDKEGKYAVNPQFAKQRLGPGSSWFDAFLVTPELGRASLSEGLTPVRIGEEDKGKIGFVDKTGKIVINPQFKQAFPFYGGLAFVVGDSGLMAYIDKEGKYVWRETEEAPAKTPASSTNANMNTDVNINIAAPNSSTPNDSLSNGSMSNGSISNASSSTSNGNSAASSQKTGHLVNDSNLRSEPNKDSASVGIHFKNAKIKVLDETSYEREGTVSTWYKIRVVDYGCSRDANLGCGKNSPGDADEGWINAKVVMLD